MVGKHLDGKYVSGKTCLYELYVHFIFNSFGSLSQNNILLSHHTLFLCFFCCGSEAFGSEVLARLSAAHGGLGGLVSAELKGTRLGSMVLR